MSTASLDAIARAAVRSYVRGDLYEYGQALNALKPHIAPDKPITCDGYMVFVDTTVVGSPIRIKEINHAQGERL